MIAILGCGVVTPVGLDALQTAAAVRAGIARVREVVEVDLDWRGRDGHPCRGGFLTAEYLDDLHRKTHGVEVETLAARTLQLGGAALRQLAPLLAPHDVVPSLVLGVGHPRQLPGDSASLLLDNLMRQAQVRLRLDTSEVLPPGRAAGLLAVHRAAERLAAGEPGPILAGGVDSYFELGRLWDLESEGRLLNELDQDGFLPGEAAALVLLGRGGDARWKQQGLVLASHVGFELGHLRSAEPLLGDGLSETLAGVLGSVPAERLPCATVYANLNGESLGAKEWGVAYLRNRRFFAEGFELCHPADCTGDGGAAMGPLLVALATAGLAQRAGLALVWCSADGGERAALCLGR